MTARPPTARGGAETIALETRGLGIRDHSGWTLRHCDIQVPRGRIAGLVGPNGDGKSSLLAVAAGLLPAAEGSLRVLGRRPGAREARPLVGSLLQDRPLHRAFTVAETLRLGRELNPRWDQAAAHAIVTEAEVPLTARVGRLSGGQRTCLALALLLGKRPELLLLDEPTADLDPLRRHAVMGALMTTAAEHGTTVVMSSHVLTELDLVCDYVLLLAHGRMLLADDVEFVQAAHTRVTRTITGSPAERGGLAARTPLAALPPEFRDHTVVEARTTGRQLTAMLRLPVSPEGAESAEPPTLEDILLAYLRNPEAPPLLAPVDDPGQDPGADPAGGTHETHETPGTGGPAGGDPGRNHHSEHGSGPGRRGGRAAHDRRPPE
ncbi:ATP-binding cassette domain-containing protein [Streptomyces sp. NBC_01190]|uniref:ATP-binding cassette domain-containing protein n=1 Tax=Streptomyces sp. NBC_01190 TaxID=2903767 RepID=UPI003869F523|nr:ABC transporter ATP-binding protein [Streptomyces sp. NBC_01190]